MRIVAGRHRGRHLAASPGKDIRPTSDRAREALFNILAHGRFARAGDPGVLAGAVVLDAFCGTGALALEALSRGAAAAVLFDSSRAALAVARSNLRQLGEEDRALLLVGDATDPPSRPATQRPASLVFLDPPYRSGLAVPALAALDRGGWIAEAALVVVETDQRETFDPPTGFILLDARSYGKAKIRFLRKEA